MSTRASFGQSKFISLLTACVALLISGCQSEVARSEVVLAADAPTWPRFHGAAGDNISTDTGLMKSWPDGGPQLLWTAKGLGQGYSSVSLAHGLIFTAGNIGGETVVVAMDLDGKIVWKTPCGGAWTGSYEGTRSTPTIDGDRLYYESPLGEVVCLNVKDGKQIWAVNIMDEFVAKNLRWALAESVVIDGDLLICSPFGEKGSVVALNKMSGETVWASEPMEDMAGYATPTIAEFAGRRMVLTMSGNALVGVDMSDGKQLFRYEHLTRYDVNALKPVYDDGYVFISSGYRSGSEMIKLTADGDGIVAEQAWASKEMDNHHGGVIVKDGYIYGAASSGSGKWVCFDWKTGETKFTTSDLGKGSLTMAEGLLYTLSENGGTVALVKPDPSGLEIISEFKIPEGGEGKVWAHPVVCGGRLYIRHDNQLFAYEVK